MKQFLIKTPKNRFRMYVSKNMKKHVTIFNLWEVRYKL